VRQYVRLNSHTSPGNKIFVPGRFSHKEVDDPKDEYFMLVDISNAGAATINDQIGTRWKQRGISLGLACDQPTDPPGQNRTELEQPGTPQQNNFVNAKEVLHVLFIHRTV